MPYPFLGAMALSYTQYIDTGTGHMLQVEPGGTYDMQPVPGADGLAVPPGDGLWGEAPDSAPPGANDQPAPKGGKNTKPAAETASEG